MLDVLSMEGLDPIAPQRLDSQNRSRNGLWLFVISLRRQIGEVDGLERIVDAGHRRRCLWTSTGDGRCDCHNENQKEGDWVKHGGFELHGLKHSGFEFHGV